MDLKKEECNVCIEKYTSSIRKKKVQCNYCDYHSCIGCAQKYLLSQAVDAHCMSCRTGWNREFIDLNMSKTFRTKEWREHKKIMILNREKAILPTMQVYAAAKKIIDEITVKQFEKTQIISKIQVERTEQYMQISRIKNSIINNLLSQEEEVEEIKKLDEMLKVLNVIDNNYIKADIELYKYINLYTIQYNIYYD